MKKTETLDQESSGHGVIKRVKESIFNHFQNEGLDKKWVENVNQCLAVE